MLRTSPTSGLLGRWHLKNSNIGAVSNGTYIIYGARQSRKKKTTMVRTWNQMPCWVSICFHQLCTSLVSYSNRTQQCLMAKPITSKLHTLFFPIDAHYFIYYFFKWNDSKFYIEIGSAPMMLHPFSNKVSSKETWSN